MKVNVTYPNVAKKVFHRKRFIRLMKWPLLLSAISCAITNIVVGGPAWSVIAIMGIYIFWHLVLSTDLVEYNRISQFIKASIYSCILMFLIDTFLTDGGWALDVISIINFASVIISGILFVTDFKRQKQNILPMFYLIIIALIWSVLGFSTAMELKSWPLIVLAGATILLIFTIIFTLKGDFIREIKCRFHIK